MQSTKLQTFKSLFTERMTATSIELFAQFEHIVEEYCVENTRLKETLNAVLNPEIRLCRVDQGSTASTIPTLEECASVGQVQPEIWHRHVKEEPETHEISHDRDATTPIILKVEGDTGATFIQPPKVEDDSATPSVIPKVEDEAATTSLIHPPKVEDGDVLKVECKDDGSISTVSDVGMACDDDSDFAENTVDHPQPPTANENQTRKKCSQCKECGQSLKRKRPRFEMYKRCTSRRSSAVQTEHHDTDFESGMAGDAKQGGKLEQRTKKKARKPVQKTILQLPRTTMKPSESLVIHDKTFFSRLVEAFKDIPDDKKPLITKMGLKDDVPLVDSAFGKVPRGCPLSYHHPVPSSRDYTPHDDCPSPPSLPLASHKLRPALSPPVLSDKSQEHMKSLETTWDGAHNLELSTRGLTGTVDELRKFRLTSRFMDVCNLKGGVSHAKQLASKIQKGTRESSEFKRDEELRPEALREYCRQMFVNWSPCGLVVHPDAPWLAAIPDGMIYDPTETPKYGLVYIKCPKARSFVECKFLDFQYGILELKKTHAHYFQMQGEMMVTGTEWCDLVVYAEDDILVQRIYRNKSLFKMMKEKLDYFFFHHYLPSLNSV